MKVGIKLEGSKETLRAIGKLPKEANAEIRATSKEIAEVVAREAAAEAKSNKQSALVAPSIKAKSDRVPYVYAGGKTRAKPSSARRRKTKPTMGDIFFGAEFGGGRGLNTSFKSFEAITRAGRRRIRARRATIAGSTDQRGRSTRTSQFRPHKGRTGYFLFPTIRKRGRWVTQQWEEAADRVLRKWSSGG